MLQLSKGGIIIKKEDEPLIRNSSNLYSKKKVHFIHESLADCLTLAGGGFVFAWTQHQGISKCAGLTLWGISHLKQQPSTMCTMHGTAIQKVMK